MVIRYRLKDTGLDNVGGNLIYTPIDSGNWIDFNVSSNRFEFTVNTTNNVATRTNSTNASLMDFKSNEVSALMSPRFTLRGLVKASDAATINNLINLGRSKGIKRLSGGLGTISGLPEVQTDTYDYISVVIKNITVSEVINKDEDYADMTIQLEQVN